MEIGNWLQRHLLNGLPISLHVNLDLSTENLISFNDLTDPSADIYYIVCGTIFFFLSYTVGPLVIQLFLIYLRKEKVLCEDLWMHRTKYFALSVFSNYSCIFPISHTSLAQMNKCLLYSDITFQIQNII